MALQILAKKDISSSVEAIFTTKKTQKKFKVSSVASSTRFKDSSVGWGYLLRGEVLAISRCLFGDVVVVGIRQVRVGRHVLIADIVQVPETEQRQPPVLLCSQQRQQPCLRRWQDEQDSTGQDSLAMIQQWKKEILWKGWMSKCAKWHSFCKGQVTS